MSLRGRLVLALVVLFAAGLAVYGFASFQAFARAESARFDEQVRQTVPLVVRELAPETATATLPDRDDGDNREGEGRGGVGRGSGDRGGPPRLVIAPGTYAELRDPDGVVLDVVQVGTDAVTPPLDGVTLTDGRLETVEAQDGTASWRVAAETLEDGHRVLVAVPTTGFDAALDRLLAIQLVAGSVLLLVLGLGAWAVLRSGLRPLERMASAARSITAGNLDQRVPTPSADTEVRDLAEAINGMLDVLEVAFRDREATEARLRRFLSDASHELRTPLTSIRGYAELFRLTADRDELDLELVMRRIESEADRMRALVEDLLALARLDEADGAARDPVDLAVLAADACSDAAAVAPDRPIALRAPTAVPVNGNARLLRQAIGNLVTNALRHTPEGTALHVAATWAGGTATLHVRDEGPGLSPDALEKVFERFWQADPSRTGTGAGLGLAIVQAVATEHGGAISAANHPDGGAVFTLTLPIAPPLRTPRSDDLPAAPDEEVTRAR